MFGWVDVVWCVRSSTGINSIWILTCDTSNNEQFLKTLSFKGISSSYTPGGRKRELNFLFKKSH